MNKFVFASILIFFICITTVICVFKPKTHKHIMFENRNFKLELISQKAEADKQEVNIDISANIPQINFPEIEIKQPEQKVKQLQSSPKTDKPSTNKTTNSVNKSESENKKTIVKPQTAKNKNSYANQQKKETQKPIKTEIKTPAITEPKIVKENKEEIVAPPVPPVIKSTEQKQELKEQTLSEQELEIIAWNKWRSDLQNKLMRDSKISAPLGTTFYFSFTVDKFGNITNLKTWSNNPSYTPLAVRVIKPLLLSYQHTAILIFPSNSKRIITNAEGSFTMAHSSRYSSPSDYNDYERIVK